MKDSYKLENEKYLYRVCIKSTESVLKLYIITNAYAYGFHFYKTFLRFIRH